MVEFFINDFQKQIWEDNTRYNSETIEETQHRLVNTIFENESKELKSKLYNALINRRIIFGGRVSANTGTNIKGTHAFNCYICQRATKPYDSIDGIYTDLKNAANILKTEGGIGFNFNHLRPKGTFIKGIGISSPGVVDFMELYDKSAEIITKGNMGETFQSEGHISKKKIRKGAQMGMLSCWHPDIINFIEAKKVPNRLEKFNMSVLITDEFMKAVESKGDWNLKFPDIHYEKYDAEWSGDIEEWESKNYPVVIYKTLKAEDLWDLILKNTYNRNEPGVFFIDNANKYNNLKYYQKFTSTNPCGEIPGMGDSGIVEINGVLYEHLGDICNLGSLNLPMYFSPEKEDQFDYELFRSDMELLVRSLDNLIDISGYPFEKIKTAAMLRRKIGCGFMGYGSLLIMKGLRFNSKKGNDFTKKFASIFANTAYQTSANLAKEKGSFLLYDENKIFENGFIKNSGILSEETLELMRLNGLRNSALLAIAPNGNTSIYAGIMSGGIEPVFELEFVRWVIANHEIENLLKNISYPDFSKKEWFETSDFKFISIGEDQILQSVCGNFRIDKNRGLTKRVECVDYGWKQAQEIFTQPELKKMESEGVFATSMELTAEDHIENFCLISKYIDNSLSKTINLKSDYSFDNFSELYFRLWKEGARGCTTYREGTMTAVLESKKENDANKNNIKKEQKEFYDHWKEHETGNVVKSVKLPDEYPAQGYVLRSEAKKWYIHVSFKDKKMEYPFAIFCSTNAKEPDILTYSALDALESLAKNSYLPVELIEDNKKKCSGHNNINKLARTISFLLRHNVDTGLIVSTLDKLELPVSSFVFRLKKFLMRFVYEIDNSNEQCPICSGHMIYTEGCKMCSSCGYSKC